MIFKSETTRKEFERNKRALKKEFKDVAFISYENNKVFFAGFDNMLRENETTPLLFFASDPKNRKTFIRCTAAKVRNIIKGGATK